MTSDVPMPSYERLSAFIDFVNRDMQRLQSAGILWRCRPIWEKQRPKVLEDTIERPSALSTAG